MIVLTILLLIAVLTLVFLVFRIGSDVRAIREEVIPIVRSLARSQAASAIVGPGMPMFGHGSHTSSALHGVFVIWEWQNGKWRLKTDTSAIGIDPGSPPAHPGAFEGDHAKSWVPNR
jgi:hypothetical protein